ncbi:MULTISPECIES: flagellar biosynthesis anti-sigma factor FlgM [Marinobacter]|uniref:Negative regulator of flagellin synthesis n=1 Tax=Marinobacter xestospongiae TaxID=994319 RepID=A0ABU3VYJ5_9GAMM|nr:MULTISPECIES: flagellar biosynthesis anti-sigma factor FlgM [Marinobacter]MCG8519798.1 flagellar biosynthesis anti-sigma factor FlgM [Pseudomonadales bacterium]MCK7565721.1 flagellar biosynthesis anti-sigma factor FlgM [Marinobacter xestospongiae]MDV2079363.1 flagellar biosynthesis anti-sigma factor FlgM [Marinobacter xestospongiae]UDL03452.1 flagellar biosynthesis anti-sigma factor FlgM [Marinobacter sp. CA1]
MSVDFNGIGPGQVNTQKTTADKTGSAPKQPATPTEQAQQTQNARGESVKLSSQAKDLKQVEQRLSDYPEVDDERIEQIRNALADGSYKVDAQKLAQKMLDMDKSIFG